jgi:hypothetical protein
VTEAYNPAVTSNVATILEKMRQRRRAVERELGVAARALAPKLNAHAKRIVQADIYNIPEKRSKRTGKKLWKRSGDLKRRERGRAEGVNVILENRSNHAAPRSALGSDGP